MIAIVVDTNVFVAAFLKGGKPLAVLQTAQQSKTVLLITPALETELSQVLQRLKFKRHFEEQGLNPTHLLMDYARVARQITPAKIENNPVRDDKDLKFLECALGGKADYLVTGDQDLLVLNEYEGIRIVTPAQFLSILFPPDEPE